MAAGRPPDHRLAEAAAALKEEASFSTELLRRHGWRLLLVFAGLLLPLWGFAELAEEIHEQEAIGFDEPLLRFVHGFAGAGFDRVFDAISKAGYSHGVVPVDIALVLVLTLLRRFREATFAAVALGGAALLNVAAKHSFARDRPALWESISPEATFSFPSAHAMGSAALACVLVALAWGTPWRWPVVALAGAFVFAVGLSRIYLGVHYPSDILAGWAASTAWALAVYLVVFRAGVRPWRPSANTAPTPT